jgi:hypothetical protein
VGWQVTGGIARDLPRATLAQVRNNLLAQFALRELTAFLKDRNCTFTCLGESRVDGKPVLGIKVAREGNPEVKLYFDKRTGFLLKRETTTAGRVPRGNAPARPTARPTSTLAMVFEDYQEAAGIKVPFRVSTFRDGKKISEKEVLEFKPVDKFDDETFTKP